MSIPSYARTNFQTLLRAAGDGNLALTECLDAVTGSPRYVICAVGRDNGDYIFTPFGRPIPAIPKASCAPTRERRHDRHRRHLRGGSPTSAA